MNDRLIETMELGIWQRIPLSDEAGPPKGPRVVVAYLAMSYAHPKAKVWFTKTVRDLPGVDQRSLKADITRLEVDPQLQPGRVMRDMGGTAVALSDPYAEQTRAVITAQALMGDDAPCAVFGMLRDIDDSRSHHLWVPRDTAATLLFEYFKRAAQALS